MNKRIRELLIEAGVYGCDVNDPEFVVPGEQKKFAELIVRECTNMLPEDSVRNADGVHMFYAIREHFGVSTIGR